MNGRIGLKAAAFALAVSLLPAWVFGAFNAESGEIALEMAGERLEFDGQSPIVVDARWFGGEAESGELRVAVQKTSGGETEYLYPLAREKEIAWTPRDVGESGESYTLRLEKKSGEGYADTGVSKEIFVGGIVKATAGDIEISIPAGDLRVDEAQTINCSAKWDGIAGGTSQLVIKNTATGETETKNLGSGETDFRWSPDGIGEYELTHNILVDGVVRNSVTKRVAYSASTADDTSASFAMDLSGEGPDNVRVADAGGETIAYSSRWSGGDGATVTVSANGVPLAEGKSGEGEIAWKAERNGTYLLKHVTYENGAETGTETATFIVSGRDEELPSGAVTVRGYEGKYDGVEHGADFAVDGVNGLVLKYVVTGVDESVPSGAWSNEKPSFVDAGDYKVWCEISAAGYVTQTNSAVVSIAKRPVTLTSGSASRAYDGTALMNENVTVSGDGFVAGEGATWSVTGSITEAGSAANAFGYTLKANTKSANYDIAKIEGTLTVAKAVNAWTTEPAIAGWKYGQTPNAPVGAARFGDVRFEYSPSPVAAAGNYTMTATVAETANWAGLTKTVSFAIAKATYDMGGVAWSSDAGFKYDGSEKRVELVGLPGGVTAAYSGNAATDAGAYRATATLSGDANYETPVVAAKDWSIAKRSITLSAKSKEKTYDGTALSVEEGDIAVGGDGYANGEKFEYCDFASITEVGETAATFGYRESATAKAVNYAVTMVGWATLKVTAPSDQIVVSSDSKTWAYDGEEHSAKSWTVANAEKLLAGHEFEIKIADASRIVTPKDGTNGDGVVTNVFEYVRIVDSATRENKTANYSLRISEGVLKMTNACIRAEQIAGAGDVAKTYDGVATNMVVTAELLQPATVRYGGTEESIGEAASATFRNATNAVVWYAVAAEHYNSYTGKVNVAVAKRSVTLTGPAKSKEYDGNALTFGSDEIAVGGDGFVDGEGVEYSGFSSRVDAGTSEAAFGYAAADGTNLGNYEVTVQNGSLTVTKAGNAWTVEPGIAGWTYGQAANAPVGAARFGEVRFEYSPRSVGAAGNYTMTATVAETANWAGLTKTVSFSIAKASGITDDGSEPGDGTVPSGGLSKFDTSATYDGTGHTIATNELETAFAALGVGGVSFAYATGMVDGDTAPGEGWTDIAPCFTNAGEYAVWYRVESANYDPFVRKALVKIGKKALTLSSGDRTKVYDGEALTFAADEISVEGLVDGESIAFSNFASITDVGDCEAAFTCAADDGTQLENYEATVTFGTLSVTKATYDMSAVAWSSDAGFKYDGTEHRVELTGLPAGVTVVYSGDAATDAGNYTASAMLTGSSNYFAPSVADCDWSIAKRTVTLTSGSASKAYDGTALMKENVAVSGDGFVAGEGASYSFAGSITDAGIAANAFGYALNANTKSVNYDIAKIEGTLIVTKAVNAWTTEPAIAGWKYGQTPNAPVGAARFGDVRFEYAPSPVGAAGNYTMTATVADTANYGGLTKTVPFAITKASGITDDGNEPGDGTVPFGGLSKFDASATYDGTGHTIATNALESAFGALEAKVGPVAIEYGYNSAATMPGAGEWRSVAPAFTNAGEYAVWYRATNANCEDFVRQAKLTIAPRDISLASIGAIPDQTWTGSAVAPVIAVTDVQTIDGAETDIIGSDDYDIAFADNVAPGAAKAIVSGKRNYTGTIEASFTILAPPPAKVEVTLDAMGGKVGTAAKQTVEMSGGIYSGLPRAVRDGCVFQGWFDGVGAGATEAKDGEDLLSDMPHTLYARWANDPAVCDESLFAWEDVDADTVAITGFRNPDQKIDRLVIPDSIKGKYVVAIKPMAFANSQSGMKELYLPVFCLSVGDKAFLAVPTLKKIEFAPVRDWTNPGSEAASLMIGEYAFAGATGLEELYLGEKVGAIRDYAFLNARNLSKVTILGKPEFGRQAFRSAGMDAGGVTVHLSPTHANDTRYLATVQENMHNVTVKTDAVVRSVRTAALAHSAKSVRLAVSVEQASSWGEVDASRLQVEYRETLSSPPVMLAPKAVKTDEGFVLEVEPPDARSGFFKVIVEE